MQTGKCFYIPILNEKGGMINDPVLLKLDDDMFWISIADSDILLWANGIAIGLGLDVKIKEPDVKNVLLFESFMLPRCMLKNSRLLFSNVFPVLPILYIFKLPFLANFKKQ